MYCFMQKIYDTGKPLNSIAILVNTYKQVQKYQTTFKHLQKITFLDNYASIRNKCNKIQEKMKFDE